jgi:small subunit ribosomal protein S5
MKGWNKDKTKKEFDELLLEVRRVTRVTTWGRRMSFRATVLAWNRKWKIWLWVAKWADVSIAVSKASREAYKNMSVVPLTKDNTVPYMTSTKYKSCIVRLLPAKAGTGLKAGSSVRSVLELAGYENMLSKIIGSNNKLNNALVTIKALSSYKHKDHFVNMLTKKGEKTQEIAPSVENKEAVAVVETPKVEKNPVEKKAPAKKPAAKK